MYPYWDYRASKLVAEYRPALVMSDTLYPAETGDALCLQITKHEARSRYDVPVREGQLVGLDVPSVVRTGYPLGDFHGILQKGLGLELALRLQSLLRDCTLWPRQSMVSRVSCGCRQPFHSVDQIAFRCARLVTV